MCGYTSAYSAVVHSGLMWHPACAHLRCLCILILRCILYTIVCLAGSTATPERMKERMQPPAPARPLCLCVYTIPRGSSVLPASPASLLTHIPMAVVAVVAVGLMREVVCVCDAPAAAPASPTLPLKHMKLSMSSSGQVHPDSLYSALHVYRICGPLDTGGVLGSRRQVMRRPHERSADAQRPVTLLLVDAEHAAGGRWQVAF